MSLKVTWKRAARFALHDMGGLAVLRRRHRREFGVLMFHAFGRDTDANMEAICSHITRHFEPVSLSQIVDAIEGRTTLPDNAVTVTVDDGYRNFLHGHSIFKKHKVPATIYAVAGFAAGQLWLWPDQVEFGLKNSPHAVLRFTLSSGTMDLPLDTPEARAAALTRLLDILKETPNDERKAFMKSFNTLCGVDIPLAPPPGHEALTGDELRALSADGVEIGCHTETHPILSRVQHPDELKREIAGAKQHLEEQTGIPIRHFCYPNGRAIDINSDVLRLVREAGYQSAVTCTWGLNTTQAERFQIRRIPFDSRVDLGYGVELMAGLHM
jgi:peptidoglycan/xylan/chitin deacetylase (PgdA/CDA1 family)